MTALTRVLVANRGEIAVRVVDACHALGMEAVVAVSEADRHSLPARRADRAVCIGPAPAAKSYLNVDALLMAALGTGCEGVHPGYGFMAERADFRRRCEENDLVFVGPSAEAIDTMGDKLRSRALAQELEVPTLPGSDEVPTPVDAGDVAERIGYPVMLKASAGGGGRGMRIVWAEPELRPAFERATAEARDAFGDGRLYMERYVDAARHVEIQVLGDGDGGLIHLGERDCSAQRRHQKLLEEAPSPVLRADTRERMASAATRLAAGVRYASAGTVEFIVDPGSQEFFFLEMNTRIQVEHPVTEMVTGLDLVAQQLLIAQGAELPPQSDVVVRGHAIECRINADDPARGFLPGPGTLTRFEPPEGERVRVDTHCFPGYAVPPFYDSLLAKLIVGADDRPHAIERTLDALERFVVEGIPTTIPFHRALLAHDDFRGHGVTTRFVEDNMELWASA